MSRVDVLNLEWRSFPSRDRDAATLVANYLRHQGKHVIEGCVFEGYELIRKYEPRLLYIGSSIGAEINLKLIKYAKSKGAVCVSGVAEGNFRREGIEEFVWGHNKEQVLYEDRLYVWSEQAKQFTLEAFPALDGRVETSGGVGFDLYQMISRDRSWLWHRTGGVKYEKVIGVGCWDFGVASPADPRYQYFVDYYGETAIEYFREEQAAFNKVLLELIPKNPDALFILKEHPGRRLGYWASGIAGCEDFENVVIDRNGVSIKDCLRVSDLWISYESNTAMEAWLCGVPSGLLNPGGIDFPKRHSIHKGQPNFVDADQWDKAIKVLYATGELPGFAEKADIREEIIRNTMQWQDGLNHVRFGNGLLDLLQRNTPVSDPAVVKGAPNFPKFPETAQQWLLWHGAPLLRHVNHAFSNFWKQCRESWRPTELGQYAAVLMEMQLELYMRQGLDKAALRAMRPS